jgi:aminoglycoside 2'-N-acetyltransferase I
MMKMVLDIVVKKYRDLSETELIDIIALCSRAFETDYRPFLDTFTDPTHVLGYYENTLVSHALWITRWLQVQDRPLMRTAYIEGVATDQLYRNRGFASEVMKRLAEETADFEIGGLCTGIPDFYSRFGWQVWKGPLFNRKNNELIPTSGGPVMVLPSPNTPALDLSTPLSIEWREGEVW